MYASLVSVILLITLAVLWKDCGVPINKSLQQKSIAIIGNGPLSTKYLDNIKRCDQTVCFNHCRHANAIGNSCDYLCLRQWGDLPTLSYVKTPVLEQLQGHVAAQNIMVFGTSKEFILTGQVKKAFPRAIVTFHRTWEAQYQNVRDPSDRVKFANELLTIPEHYPWGFTTGFLAICHFLEMYETVDIYGFTFEKPVAEYPGHPREFERQMVSNCSRCRVHAEFT